MDVQSLIDRRRRLTYTTSTQYTNTQALEDLNEVYKDLITTITNEINEDYFYENYTADTVVGQNEYSFVLPTSTVTWMDKLKELYIKYSSTGDYKKCSYVWESTMEKPFDFYKTNQSAENPIFYIADKSLFIFPTPTEAVTNWLKISVTTMPIDLLITDTEDKIKIERQYHNTLWLWLDQYIYIQKWMIQESNNAAILYNNSKAELIRKMGERDLSPLETHIPDLSYYE